MVNEDMMFIQSICTILVSIGLFLATLYRIRIEREHVKVTIENARSAEKLKMIRKVIEREKDEIRKMDGKEFLEFLKEIFKDEK